MRWEELEPSDLLIWPDRVFWLILDISCRPDNRGYDVDVYDMRHPEGVSEGVDRATFICGESIFSKITILRNGEMICSGMRFHPATESNEC